MAVSGRTWLRPSRRQIIAGGAAALAIPPGSALAHSARQMIARRSVASGFVFEDVEGTGVRTPGMPGVPGVMVSNGHDVALTASDGSWRLPVEPGRSLFVVKPSGWSTPHGRGGLPSFSHLHQPGGSPREFRSRFVGVSPTGPLPASIDFPLRREYEPAKFDVLLVADTQPGNGEELGFVRDALLSRVPEFGARFAIHHGDVMGDDLALFDRYVALLNATGIPWHHCPGNHDMNLDAGDPAFFFETWKRVFGPPHYAFQHSGATFIVLNNVEPLHGAVADKAGRGYRGAIGAAQCAFVANILKHVPDEHLVVVSMHIPLVSYEDPDNPADTTADRRRLLEILAKRPRTVSFAGHSHTTEHHYLSRESGFDRALPHHHHVLTAACGNWWSGPRDRRGIPYSESRDGTPKGCHVLSIDEARYETRFIAIGDLGSAQMRIMIDSGAGPELAERGRAARHQISASQRGGARILVNVFDGGPLTKVALTIDGRSRSAIEMQLVEMCDPYVVEFLAERPETCKPWAMASPSSHIWACGVPPQIEPGVHRVSVRARSEYGREHIGHMLIEVTS